LTTEMSSAMYLCNAVVSPTCQAPSICPMAVSIFCSSGMEVMTLDGGGGGESSFFFFFLAQAVEAKARLRRRRNTAPQRKRRARKNGDELRIMDRSTPREK